MRATISRRPLLLTGVSILSGLAALVVAGAAVSAAARSARSHLVDVLVAARPVAEGAVLEAGDVRVVAVPAEAAPAGRVAAVDAPGRTVTVPLLAGDPVLAGKLAPSGRGVSALVPPGSVAASVVPATPIDVAVGERVRITATFAPAALVVDHVAKTGRVVVAVSPAEHERLTLAAATARVDLAVLAVGGRGDADVVTDIEDDVPAAAGDVPAPTRGAAGE